MNIAEALGTNSTIVSIQMYCAQYEVTLTNDKRDKIENLRRKRESFFVFIGRTGVDMLMMQERSEILGKIVGGRLRRGAVLWINRGYSQWVNWDNWKDIYRQLTPRKQYIRDDRPSRAELQAHKELMELNAFVKEGMPELPKRKTMDENALYLKRGYCPWFDYTAQAKQKSSTVKEMRGKIFEVDMSLV